MDPSIAVPNPGLGNLSDPLANQGVDVGRRHVRTLMKKMGIEAIYRKPNTSKPAVEHKIYPYLLRKLKVERPNQVWATDITDIPMAKGFVYLTAVVDWFTRRVLTWRLSIMMEAEFCVEALQEALARYGKPEIFNTDHRVRSSRRPPSPRCSSTPASRSAWTAKGLGGTTSSSSGSGGRSNTKKCTSAPTPRSPRPAPRSAAISAGTTVDVHT